MKTCRNQSASMLETDTWIFSISFMMDDIIWPVELRFEKVGILPQHVVEYLLPKIHDRGEADLVHQVVPR